MKIDYGEYRHSGLGSKVFEILRNDILDGKYKPGESITEIKLSNELGVSRTPIREALRQLELEGLVCTIPNRGTVVKGISNQDVKDIYKIRMLVEGIASRRATENITPDELNELREAVELEEFYTSRNDIAQLTKQDTKFHDILFRSSKSWPLTHMLSTFHQYLQKTRNTSMSIPGRAEKTWQEHKAILQAIESGDADMAEQLTTQHIKNASMNLEKKSELRGESV
ncbi:MAG: GntR family transcriptional regulator [Eubacteriales bacterium]|nr:GntR family transcriptional regulator [Eubacteriales bacterium]